MANSYLRICYLVLWLFASLLELYLYLSATRGIAPNVAVLWFLLWVLSAPLWPFFKLISAWISFGKILFDLNAALREHLGIELPKIETWRDWWIAASQWPPAQSQIHPPPPRSDAVLQQWVDLFPLLGELQRRVAAGEPVGLELRSPSTTAPSLERDLLMPALELRGIGSRVARLIEHANKLNCPVRNEELTYDALSTMSTHFRRYRVAARTASEFQWWDQSVPHPAWIGWTVRFDREAVFMGMIAQGIMVITTVARHPVNIQIPHTGSIFNTLYLDEYGTTDSLRQIFVTIIINVQTRAHLATLGREAGSQTYERGTPEYEAILGIRIGRTVGYLVIAAFARGTRRIARIELIYHRSHDLRFEIENNS
ncbi:hypothetical protein N7478_001839 [Penicillium angulare]|uniref:uncharacterized protein n=1 Tax=Penicillium angulare TaxID=116970 RepID=UPI002541A1E4|nr:uncharacterized protein N7478_001839 [Penicillium angulare]KAJ5288809.1 hypothetical protein N7478_001839 [Penicillium angulare]